MQERDVTYTKPDRLIVLNQCGPTGECNESDVVLDAIGASASVCPLHPTGIETQVSGYKAVDGSGLNPAAECFGLVALQVALEAVRGEDSSPFLKIQPWLAGIVAGVHRQRNLATDLASSGIGSARSARRQTRVLTDGAVCIIRLLRRMRDMYWHKG
jgi:hypothetical protein